MPLENVNELIQKPFHTLGFDDHFLEQCRGMELTCLEDLRQTGMTNLVKKEDFSYLWLEKLSTYLRQKDMLHLLQEEPGSRNG